MTTVGSAVALVRLCLDMDDQPQALETFNVLVGELDLETAQEAIQELALFAAGLLQAMQDRHPGIDADELVARCGLRLAVEPNP